MKCKDCDKEADPQYTMDFNDVEPGAKIHWCSEHGPGAHLMNDALTRALTTRPGFAQKLAQAIDDVRLKTN